MMVQSPDMTYTFKIHVDAEGISIDDDPQTYNNQLDESTGNEAIIQLKQLFPDNISGRLVGAVTADASFESRQGYMAKITT